MLNVHATLPCLFGYVCKSGYTLRDKLLPNGRNDFYEAELNLFKTIQN